MGTVCLSLVPNLRCVGLSHKEEVISIVPVGLEVVFSLGLVFAGRDAGRIRYILAAEGPFYLLLVLSSYLSHAAPVFQTSLLNYKALDITIGSLSFIPLLLYTSYLYLFKRSVCFPQLPGRFMVLATVFSLVVIPIILVTNEIGSFFGIRYRNVPFPVNITVGDQLAVGPDLSSYQFGREFLSSISLALLAIYQATTFLTFFVRLASCVFVQRNIEERAETEREGVLFRGIGWLAVGMKFCAMESAIGFANTSFGLVFTRRLLRMLGRACIIIGIVKGPDRKEEFLILDDEKGNEFLSGTRKLKLSSLRISSPQLVRSSMTERLSQMPPVGYPIATFAVPYPDSPVLSESGRASYVSRYPSGVPPGTLAHMPTVVEKSRPPPLILKRSPSPSPVTVVRGHGRAPTLVLHLSPTRLPSGDTLAAMSEKQSDISVPDDVRAILLPFCSPAQRTAPPLQQSMDRKSGFLQQVRGRLRSRSLSSRPRSPRLAVPAVPINRYHAPSSTSRISSSVLPLSMISGPKGDIPGYAQWPSVPAQRSPEAFFVPETSSCAGGTSTVDGISIDWISSKGVSRLARVKSIGAEHHWTTPSPTIAGSTRASIVPESQGDLNAVMKSPGLVVRKDSDVLRSEEMARVGSYGIAMI
ncbi:hypothetical protein B0F90DRAFT_1773235 [Multifurca ochricompacta]|uniref:Uncharacterized protein n=1 Tax=Multifurca ochricompacta TaxID=376703 RepID=A0AAD4LXT1_9AGAM|nr:hypothetical protein B0F90DRAFT_1773235 [Multifurca ochricompacta]